LDGYFIYIKKGSELSKGQRVNVRGAWESVIRGPLSFPNGEKKNK